MNDNVDYRKLKTKRNEKKSKSSSRKKSIRRTKRMNSNLIQQVPNLYSKVSDRRRNLKRFDKRLQCYDQLNLQASQVLNQKLTLNFHSILMSKTNSLSRPNELLLIYLKRSRTKSLKKMKNQWAVILILDRMIYKTKNFNNYIRTCSISLRTLINQLKILQRHIKYQSQ